MSAARIVARTFVGYEFTASRPGIACVGSSDLWRLEVLNVVDIVRGRAGSNGWLLRIGPFRLPAVSWVWAHLSAPRRVSVGTSKP
jgi:hypothetical protein